MYYDLSQDLDHYLGIVLGVTRRADDDTVAELARAELPQLVQTIRALLEQHRPDNRRRCPTCHGRRWLFWRRPNMPCRAYLAAHRRLVVLAERESNGVERIEFRGIPAPAPVIRATVPHLRPSPHPRPTPYPRSGPSARPADSARAVEACRAQRSSAISQIGTPIRTAAPSSSR